MLLIVTILFNLLSGIILLLSFILLIECIAALFPSQIVINSSQSEWENISVSVLIPAHNEETVITQTLTSIIPQLKSTDQIIVIADNCTDNTSEIVHKMGIKVISRDNSSLRGKGYALDFGLTYLAKNPPNIVIFIDADCYISPDSIQNLTQKAMTTHKPVQGLYLMEKPPQPTPKHQISAFAFKVKNLVRPLGLYNVKQPCLLTGTGMAFPWEVIQKANLASSHIVEDMKLGLDLAIANHSPIFCSRATITGYLPQKQEAATTQRTRWEHGHLQIALSYIPVLLKESLKQRRLDLLVIALDLSIPPLSLFVSLWLGITLISFLIFTLSISYIPLLISSIAGLMIFSAILTAWIKFGKEEIPLQTLIKIPLYILWKIPLYVKFLFKRESQWIRTERDS
ncbi:glycosyltransferase family 2 protein [Geminocystis sp.]|uniref:glycosyltransferase family 2 protein n=1 Tax=Geminocystis sp. TaxID=2664100 RepID=UPI0035945C1E